MGETEPSRGKMDVLDLIINVLRQHEKSLDKVVDRIEHLYSEPDIWLLEEKRDILKARVLTLSIITGILEEKAFSNPFFALECSSDQLTQNILLDHINRCEIVYGRSSSYPSKWNVSKTCGIRNRNEDQKELYNFDSERKMFSWIVRYVISALDNVKEPKSQLKQTVS